MDQKRVPMRRPEPPLTPPLELPGQHPADAIDDVEVLQETGNPQPAERPAVQIVTSVARTSETAEDVDRWRKTEVDAGFYGGVVFGLLLVGILFPVLVPLLFDLARSR